MRFLLLIFNNHQVSKALIHILVKVKIEIIDKELELTVAKFTNEIDEVITG